MSPEPAIIVREVVVADAEDLQRFLADLYAERLPVMFSRDSAPSVAEERSLIQQMLATPRSMLLLALAQEGVVGMLDFHCSPRQQCGHSGNFGMSVAKSWRRRGVGTRLIEELFRWARSQGVRRIELDVFENNPGAVRLYEKLGFLHEGKRREAVEVSGSYIDVLQMAKLLTSGETS